MRGSRLRPVSKKRVKTNRIYSALRKKFLAEHPYCQIWLIVRGYQINDVSCDGFVKHETGDAIYYRKVPLAVDIHHVKGRGRYLLDTSTWLAASRAEHEWVHSHQGEARRLGLLQ